MEFYGWLALMVLIAIAISSLVKKYIKPDADATPQEAPAAQENAAPPEKPAAPTESAPAAPAPAEPSENVPQSPLDMPAGKYNCQKKILKNTVIVTLIVFLSGYIIYALYKWCDIVDRTRADHQARADRALGIERNSLRGDPKSSPRTELTLRERAEQGEANAQYVLGLFCENEDFAQTIYWWRKAAEQGHRTAQRKLGECYYYGRGVEVDRQQAEYWFSKAAKQGEPLAEFMLKTHFKRR